MSSIVSNLATERRPHSNKKGAKKTQTPDRTPSLLVRLTQPNRLKGGAEVLAYSIFHAWSCLHAS